MLLILRRYILNVRSKLRYTPIYSETFPPKFKFPAKNVAEGAIVTLISPRLGEAPNRNLPPFSGVRLGKLAFVVLFPVFPRMVLGLFNIKPQNAGMRELAFPRVFSLSSSFSQAGFLVGWTRWRTRSTSRFKSSRWCLDGIPDPSLSS